MGLLEKKAEGQEIVSEAAEEEPRGKVVNLMEALQRSLAAAKKGEAPGGGAGVANRAGDKADASGERRHKAEPEHRAAARTARKTSSPKAKRSTRTAKPRRAAHR